MNYQEFFKQATEEDRFPYQERLATADKLPGLLNIPTGAGKTAAVTLGWLWRRRYAENETIRKSTPRRLVYCLPMRVLVEQTRKECRKWLRNLGLAGDGPMQIEVHVLMGGDFYNDWDLYPEREAILIGTQDMLLSRALNRGYGTTRYRWPTQFALLHSDCLWVFDETQLFGVGLKSSSQLEAFRHILGTTFPTRSLWMSATLAEDELKTVDAREQLPSPLPRTELDDADRNTPQLKKRLKAPKRLVKVALSLNEDTKKKYEKELAALILDMHRSHGGQTLAVLNTVGRAQVTYAEVVKTLAGSDEVETLLVHSRFRPHEREQLSQQLTCASPGEGRIIIATQAIEAGVDITSRTLISELAPWSSLVQRFGRCNRYGEDNEAEIHWIDIQSEKGALPYAADQLTKAREMLETLADVGPASNRRQNRRIAGTHRACHSPERPD